MRVTRRRFMQGAGAAALLAGAHVLALPRRARAALPADPIVVLVELSGGNDALNTVVPLNNVGVPQRSLYDAYRPDLAISPLDLSATQIGVDPVNGTGLALHPAMTGLAALYGLGKLAVLNGVGIPGTAPLDHAQAAEIWAAGDPAGFAGTGWLGRYSDGELDPASVPALSLGVRASPTFASTAMNAIASPTLDPFALPDDPLFPDLPARRGAWHAIFTADASDDPLVAALRRSGAQLLASEPTFSAVVFEGWGSQLENGPSALHEDLHQVVSLLRYDQLFPAAASRIGLFHVVQPGYDTHAQQGSDGSGDRHA
ncbi:MAG TPA: twin-arginine translocation signal domain-containing protein, partial [Myxococcota bacterium]|nr:twin-arginine translocation signal domain-containing protein [Myxococcota bacterium]